MLLLLVL